MTIYIITRHGSNAANQSMTPTAIIGTIEAESGADAKRIAADKWTCYANQFVSAEPFDSASHDDRDEADEADRANSLDQSQFTT